MRLSFSWINSLRYWVSILLLLILTFERTLLEPMTSPVFFVAHSGVVKKSSIEHLSTSRIRSRVLQVTLVAVST